jgi:hypothetical protein
MLSRHGSCSLLAGVVLPAFTVYVCLYVDLEQTPSDHRSIENAKYMTKKKSRNATHVNTKKSRTKYGYGWVKLFKFRGRKNLVFPNIKSTIYIKLSGI